MSIHDHNTRSKKHLSFEDAMEKMESNILEQISSLKVDVRSMKDKFLNMKDVIIKCLQDENTLLRSRCSKLEDKVVSLESSVNQVEQYGRRNNIVISGIPDDVADDDLEDAVTSIMEDVDVIVQNGHWSVSQDWEIWPKNFQQKKTLLDLSIVNTVRKH